MIKYASNAFLAMKIHYINEMANLCEKVGADIAELAVGMGTDTRIGGKFLNPGPGYGGSCFPKDTLAMAYMGRMNGVALSLIENTIQKNDERKKQMAHRILKAVEDIPNAKIAVLGLAFKGGTDDCRESPAMEIIVELLSNEAKITAYDPKALDNAKKLLGDKINYAQDAYEAVKDADVVAVLTEWDDFKGLDLSKIAALMRTKNIVDCRNLWDKTKAQSLGFSLPGSWKMKNILIVGGAGYIGSHTVWELKQNGYQCIVFDNLIYGHRQAVSEVIFEQGDLLNKSDLKNVFEKYSIDAVIHFAAYAYVGESVQNPRKYYENNVVGTLNLLNTMLDFNVKKIVFSSTCATYGEPKYTPIDEQHPQNPINPYGWSKLMIEKILADYHRAYDLKYIALRYFNASGASEYAALGESHTPETHLIPLVLKAIKGEIKQISVFGTDYPTPDGTCIRDYIHVSDLAVAHRLALQKLDSFPVV